MIGSGEGERQTRDGGSAGGREGERRTINIVLNADVMFVACTLVF